MSSHPQKVSAQELWTRLHAFYPAWGEYCRLQSLQGYVFYGKEHLDELLRLDVMFGQTLTDALAAYRRSLDGGEIPDSLADMLEVAHKWTQRPPWLLVEAPSDAEIAAFRERDVKLAFLAAESCATGLGEIFYGNAYWLLPHAPPLSQLTGAKTWFRQWHEVRKRVSDMVNSAANKLAALHSAEGEKAAKTAKARTGCPRKFDPEKDAKLFADWKSSGQRTIKDFARLMGIDEKEVREAIDRARHPRR